MSNTEAEEYKSKGNEAFKAQKWEDAIKAYNKAITLDGTQPSYYSNRAACWSSKGKHESALSDANKCIELDSAFIKGYSRKGKALFDMQRYGEAEEAYQAGLKVDPSNQSLSAGLAEVKANRARASQSSSSSGGFGSFFGGSGGFLGQFMSKMKGGGMGGRMQMYMVAFAAYYMYKNVMGTPKQSASDDLSLEAAEPEMEYEDLSVTLPSGFRRGFSEVNGKWIGYMEAPSEADNMLVFLHRTSLSAEAEFGSLLPQLIEKASADSSPKGFQVLAPDRPCHGYSPCAATGEGDAKWFAALLRSRKAKRMTYVASGAEAAKTVLDYVRQRKQPAQVLLVSPSASALAEAGSLKTADDVSSWLGQRPALSALSAAEAARWAASSSMEASTGALTAAELPDGCSVLILTAPDEPEERNLEEELEKQGITVQSRQMVQSFIEEVVAEALQMAKGELA